MLPHSALDPTITAESRRGVKLVVAMRARALDSFVWIQAQIMYSTVSVAKLILNTSVCYNCKDGYAMSVDVLIFPFELRMRTT